MKLYAIVRLHVLKHSLSTRITINFESLSSDPQEPNVNPDNVTVTSMYPRSELDPETEHGPAGSLSGDPCTSKESKDLIFQCFHMILLHFFLTISLITHSH